MIAIENVLVMGDSWASAVESDTGEQYGGWPKLLKVPKGQRLGIPGSTAHDWYTNKQNCLQEVLDRIEAGGIDLVFISLLGNDFRGLLESPLEVFIDKTATAMGELGMLVSTIAGSGVHVVSMTYMNPYPDDPIAERMVGLLNDAVERVSKMCFSTEWALSGVKEPFAKGDFHPTKEGHKAIALHLLSMMNLLPGRVDREKEAEALEKK